MKRFFFWSMLGVFILGTTKADENQTEQARCIEHVSECFQRLNVVLVKNHIAPLAFDATQLTVGRTQSFNRKIDVWQFRTSQKTFVEVLPGTCEILSIERDDVRYKAGPAYDQPPKPSWSDKQAVAAAKSYVEAVFNQFPKDVGSPRIKYEPTREVPKYYAGVWHIRWPRVDASGHLFATDAINIYISESQGLTSAAYNFFSTYQGAQGPVISQDEALKISGPAAETLAKKFIGDGLQLAAPNTVMQAVVNPNHILEAKSIEDTVGLTGTNARLVWFINYPLTSKGAPSPHQVQVWVDAQTKEVVGGDLH